MRPILRVLLNSAVAISLGSTLAGCSSSSVSSETSNGDGGTTPDARADTTSRPSVPDGSSPAADAHTAGEASPIADADLVPPPGCVEITLAGAIASTEMTNSEAYAPQPDLLSLPILGGTSSVDASIPEDASANAHANELFVYLDANDTVGTYSIAPYTNYYYAVGNGGGMSTNYVIPDASDAGSGGYTAHYVAVSGTLQVSSVLTPYQTEGTLTGVRFVEATWAADGTVAQVAGGKCYWLKSATWNTKRTGGCVPYTGNSCGSGQYCMPTNAIGDDGLCVSTGTQVLGDACALTTPGKWDSNCATGLRCAEFADYGETSYSCHQVCNVQSASNDCPAMTQCGGDYETCIADSFLVNNPQEGNEIDTVATVGQECAQNANALFCGGSGLPGTCWQNTGAAAAVCVPWEHAVSQCSTGDSAGYVAYKGGIDRSTLWCFH